MRRARAVSALVSVFALSALACGGESLPAATAASSRTETAPSAAFGRFVDEYFEAEFAAYPSEATTVGVHKYDERIEDTSREATLARTKELHAFEARLAAFDKNTLSFDERIDARRPRGRNPGPAPRPRDACASWEPNPMGYAGLPGGAVDALMKRDFAPAKDRLRSVIARLKGVPAVYAAAKANVKNPPKEFTDLAIRMANGSVGFFERIVALWAKEAAGDDAALWASSTRPTRRRSPRRRASPPGWRTTSCPARRAATRSAPTTSCAKLKHEEMVEMPLDELLARGEAQLAEGLRRVRRDGEAHRPEQDAGRGDEAALGRAPDGRGPDSRRCAARSRRRGSSWSRRTS